MFLIYTVTTNTVFPIVPMPPPPPPPPPVVVQVPFAPLPFPGALGPPPIGLPMRTTFTFRIEGPINQSSQIPPPGVNPPAPTSAPIPHAPLPTGPPQAPAPQAPPPQALPPQAPPSVPTFQPPSSTATQQAGHLNFSVQSGSGIGTLSFQIGTGNTNMTAKSGIGNISVAPPGMNGSVQPIPVLVQNQPGTGKINCFVAAADGIENLSLQEGSGNTNMFLQTHTGGGDTSSAAGPATPTFFFQSGAPKIVNIPGPSQTKVPPQPSAQPPPQTSGSSKSEMKFFRVGDIAVSFGEFDPSTVEGVPGCAAVPTGNASFAQPKPIFCYQTYNPNDTNLPSSKKWKQPTAQVPRPTTENDGSHAFCMPGFQTVMGIPTVKFHQPSDIGHFFAHNVSEYGNESSTDSDEDSSPTTSASSCSTCGGISSATYPAKPMRPERKGDNNASKEPQVEQGHNCDLNNSVQPSQPCHFWPEDRGCDFGDPQLPTGQTPHYSSHILAGPSYGKARRNWCCGATDFDAIPLGFSIHSVVTSVNSSSTLVKVVHCEQCEISIPAVEFAVAGEDEVSPDGTVLMEMQEDVGVSLVNKGSEEAFPGEQQPAVPTTVERSIATIECKFTEKLVLTGQPSAVITHKPLSELEVSEEERVTVCTQEDSPVTLIPTSHALPENSTDSRVEREIEVRPARGVDFLGEDKAVKDPCVKVVNDAVTQSEASQNTEFVSFLSCERGKEVESRMLEGKKLSNPVSAAEVSLKIPVFETATEEAITEFQIGSRMRPTYLEGKAKEQTLSPTKTPLIPHLLPAPPRAAFGVESGVHRQDLGKQIREEETWEPVYWSPEHHSFDVTETEQEEGEEESESEGSSSDEKSQHMQKIIFVEGMDEKQVAIPIPDDPIVVEPPGKDGNYFDCCVCLCHEEVGEIKERKEKRHQRKSHTKDEVKLRKEERRIDAASGKVHPSKEKQRGSRAKRDGKERKKDSKKRHSQHSQSGEQSPVRRYKVSRTSTDPSVSSSITSSPGIINWFQRIQQKFSGNSHAHPSRHGSPSKMPPSPRPLHLHESAPSSRHQKSDHVASTHIHHSQHPLDFPPLDIHEILKQSEYGKQVHLVENANSYSNEVEDSYFISNDFMTAVMTRRNSKKDGVRNNKSKEKASSGKDGENTKGEKEEERDKRYKRHLRSLSEHRGNVYSQENRKRGLRREEIRSEVAVKSKGGIEIGREVDGNCHGLDMEGELSRLRRASVSADGNYGYVYRYEFGRRGGAVGGGEGGAGRVKERERGKMGTVDPPLRMTVG